MIHLLPAPIRGNTHARVCRIHDAPGAVTEVRYQLGALDGETWTPDPLIPLVIRRVSGAERVQMLEYTATQGAPLTDGEREYRNADLLYWLDTHGWVV